MVSNNPHDNRMKDSMNMRSKWVLKRSLYDACLYYKFVDNLPTFMLLYVDDILLMSPKVQYLHSVKAYLRQEFEMKDLREASKIRGIFITWKKGKNMLCLD